MRTIKIRCKELKEAGIPLATVDKLERRKTYNVKHKKGSRRKKKRA